MKLPMGRFGSFRPARRLRTALAMAQRHSSHLADDLANNLFIHDAVNLLGFFPPFAVDRLFLLLELVGLIAEVGGLLEILLGDSRLLLLIELLDLCIQLL